MAETGGISEGPRGPARPLPAAEAPFDAIGLARMLLRTIRSGALATIDAEGMPFASLVTMATDVDGTPLMLLSRLSAHTRNLLADPRCRVAWSAEDRRCVADRLPDDEAGRAVTALILRYGTPAEGLGSGPAFRLRPVATATTEGA